MKIYTRTGDLGETSLFGGARVAKSDARIEAYGTVDELNSFIGLARATWPSSAIDTQLHQTQHDLFEIGAHLASPGTSRFPGVDEERIAELERAIDAIETELEPLRTFILPGGALRKCAAGRHGRSLEALAFHADHHRSRSTLAPAASRSAAKLFPSAESRKMSNAPSRSS